MLSMLLMCFGSLVIAVTPTYASIGAAAPVLLGLARIVQGLSLGGEYGASATYLAEVADDKHRGVYVSFHYVTLIGGPLCATLVLLILQQLFLTAEQMRAWGWRIPFVIGAMLAVIVRQSFQQLSGRSPVCSSSAQSRWQALVDWWTWRFARINSEQWWM
jgi:MHS family alpha-ketoglutarate permease-like MFS transporter